VIFAWPITVTAATTEAAPKEETLKLTHGVITRIEVKFPAGCHSLVKVRLLLHESIKVPLNKDTWLTGDDETVPCEVYEDLFAAPYELKFRACSPTCTYDHEILVRATVLPPGIATPYQIMSDLLAILKRMLGVS
jgi:hypothetical protein